MTPRPANESNARPETGHTEILPWQGMQVTLLTGGFDRHYAFGLATGLTSKGVYVDVIGSDDVDSPEMHATPRLHFLNLQGNRRSGVSLTKRVSRLLLFYARLCLYAFSAKPRIFHVLWNNRLTYIDRTMLMIYYKLLGKKVAFTAHNVDAAKRDGHESLLNRVTLKIQYRLMDHIFVHTEKMKAELLADFGVSEQAVSVIPYGINNAVPDTNLTSAEAKQRLGLCHREKAILFFGAIRPYKGLEYLVAAFDQLATRYPDYRLIIAGERKKGSEEYLDEILQAISGKPWSKQVILKIEFVPDEETEVYFKAADVLVLPYAHIFQSGVLFLSYSFGLPAIATDVGSFRDYIVDGQTGFVCPTVSPMDMASTIETYFASDLYKSLEQRRSRIQKAAHEQNSWGIVADKTCSVYHQLLGTSAR